MAKIAAIVLPSRRENELTHLCERIQRSLCLYAHHQVEMNTYRGERSVCALLRVTPDPLNSGIQPLQLADSACVACGYYMSRAAGSDADSVKRLCADLVSEGVDALPRGDGVYAFAWWDGRNERLIGGVDKLGMRPLYWACVPGGGYAVASELKVLVGLFNRIDVNWAAWEEHLTFGYVFGEHTFFEGIQRFGAAETITFREDGHGSRTVEHFLDTIEVKDRPMDVFLDEQGAVFDQTMARLAGLYDAPRQTMLTLSGGFDSRRVLGWLLNHDIRPDAYTVPEVLDDGREFESAIVRELCQTAGIDGYSVYPATVADRVRVRQLRDLATDFESDEHNFSTTLAMGLDCHDKVNFDGLGAGSQLSASFMTPAYFEPGGRERFIAAWPLSVRAWLRIPHTDAPPLEERVRAELDRWGDNPNRFAYFYLMSRTRREVSLAPLSIQANVFESLCPYLDRDMMRSALSFPPVRKVGADMQMPLIAALHPKLGRVPTTYTKGIGDDSRYLKRMGEVEQGERRILLRNVARLTGTNAMWSSSTTQKWRFRVASIMTAFSTDKRLRWEFGKAAKAAQLAHFEQVTRTPDAYGAAAAVLRDAFGACPDWCQPL